MKEMDMRWIFQQQLFIQIFIFEESLRSFFDIELRKGFKISSANETLKNLYSDDLKNEEKRKEISSKYSN